MNKISLIIQREYFSRVKNKTFILTTIFTPLLFVGIFAVSILLTNQGKSKHKVAVVDANGFFKGNLKNSTDVHFEFPEGVDTSNFVAKGFTDILIIPKFEGDKKTQYLIRSQKNLGFSVQEVIERKINAAIEDQKLQENGITRAQLDSIHSQSQFAEMKTEELGSSGVKESNAGLAIAIAYGCGILIYITMLVYGMMVLRGVMEEKTNRIAEVIISSVKPFQLMLGKIIGIGAVGITQFFIWIVLIIGLTTAAQSFISAETMEQVRTLQQNGGAMPAGGAVQASEAAIKMYTFQHTIGTANWPLIIGCFIYFFIGGYLFYASLFAAVGSVTEDVQGSQSLTVPITIPIIFSFIIMTSVIQAPDSPLAVWSSIIPFSSPIVMMARIAFGVPGTVPYWQLAASVLTLAGSFLFTTWLAGKIYRTGILLYGKKVTWKEMLKWGFRKS
ncbi:ABC transporter permease [Sediminibacterium soli]|uniref:ABC transporter permease n=1 Tax=Sediminibacterium soli TaxID=2698829 RepID=UPI0013798703|nr:ABC transporter permease [Sediminibacterium soli]NCI47991.1 ABC transporter permease [Sediminibacterium soli]